MAAAAAAAAATVAWILLVVIIFDSQMICNLLIFDICAFCEIF